MDGDAENLFRGSQGKTKHSSLSRPQGGKLRRTGSFFAFRRNPLRWVFGGAGRWTGMRKIFSATARANGKPPYRSQENIRQRTASQKL